jgi:hypothetical protein
MERPDKQKLKNTRKRRAIRRKSPTRSLKRRLKCSGPQYEDTLPLHQGGSGSDKTLSVLSCYDIDFHVAQRHNNRGFVFRQINLSNEIMSNIELVQGVYSK